MENVLTLDKAEKVCGVLVAVKDERTDKTEPPITPRQSLVDTLNGYKSKSRVCIKGLLAGEPFLRVHMDCCNRDFVYPTEDDIPYESVPCPCGNPNHWLIKYEED